VTEQADKKWYERQRQRDAESRALSESLLGPEKDMFAESWAEPPALSLESL